MSIFFIVVVIYPISCTLPSPMTLHNIWVHNLRCMPLTQQIEVLTKINTGSEWGTEIKHVFRRDESTSFLRKNLTQQSQALLSHGVGDDAYICILDHV